eukprot:scaffold272071_cov27-Prasinocladus_malaysianus.AAC.1
MRTKDETTTKLYYLKSDDKNGSSTRTRVRFILKFRTGTDDGSADWYEYETLVSYRYEYENGCEYRYSYEYGQLGKQAG